MVSIMPGIDICAPDRTDTSSGFLGSPKPLPVSFSTFLIAALTWSINPGGIFFALRYLMQISVVMVNPGGTGRPRLLISARFAPLPPSNSFMSLLPSWKR